MSARCTADFNCISNGRFGAVTAWYMAFHVLASGKEKLKLGQSDFTFLSNFAKSMKIDVRKRVQDRQKNSTDNGR